MTACPKCGAAIEEGKAYCDDPACGAVLPGPAERQSKYIAINKEVNLNFKLDFVMLARMAALAIAALAAALLYFSRK
ncbi:MAG: hypothetical protein PHV33_09995 [Elusimicrobiales bacterium]|nr:hypothetical protein [Elusimicrobiales bacterium]